MNHVPHMYAPGNRLLYSFGLRRHVGVSLIEVLVSIVILMIGLLGLAGLQSRAYTTQMESYQRSQALILLQDMAARINANRKNANTYVTSGLSPPHLGTDNMPGNCTGLSGQPLDFCEWNNALLGAAETQTSGGAKVGAMLGARGCVFQEIASATGVAGTYQVVVAWQGLNSTAKPDNSTAASPRKCGLGLYRDRDGAVDETLHRAIAIPVSVADLS